MSPTYVNNRDFSTDEFPQAGDLGPEGFAFVDKKDSPTYVDPNRTAIPHTKPTMRYRIYRASVGNSHAVVTVEKILIAAIATTLVGLALGLDRPDWGAVSVLLLLQWGPDHVPELYHFELLGTQKDIDTVKQGLFGCRVARSDKARARGTWRK